MKCCFYFLPFDHRPRGAVELRVTAAQIEHARPSGGKTQVSSPRAQRALTVCPGDKRFGLLFETLNVFVHPTRPAQEKPIIKFFIYYLTT
jgi:hypothetical protein